MSQQVFEQLAPRGPTLNEFDRLSLVAYRIFKAPAHKISKSIPSLREELLKSNMRVTPDGLISVALFWTVVSALGTLVAVGYALAVGFPYLLLVAPLPAVVFILTLNLPKLSQSNRRNALDNELPFIIGYMSILAGGGLSLIDSLRRISELQIFPAASYEAKRVLIDVDVFGDDPLTALDKAAKYSPSKAFSALLTGYTTVLRTGGDYVNYLNLQLKEAFEERTERTKRSVETTGLVAESYLIVTVVLGVTLFTLFLVETIIDGNSSSIESIYFFSYLLIPIFSAGFCWLLDAVQPQWPLSDYRPYKIFALFIPVGVAVFLIPLPLQLYLHLSLALIAVSLVPSFYASKYSRERRTIEKMLPGFINDVSEGRKIGLPPEASIERLGDTNYRGLSKYVSKMAAQLSWGVSLTKVISSFAHSVNSWIAKVVGTLLLEVVEVGGGTMRGFADMAEFTQRMSSIEAERRSVLRHYVIIIYIGGMMLLMTTFMMILLLNQQSSLHVGTSGANFITTKPGTLQSLLTAGIFSSFVLGIVAGKMGEGAVSEGFKHGLILVVLNVVAIAIISRFFALPV
ncbi:MAG TPA: type II secretion system F family protein [Nitrososphaerales archaeon]|nr:type II secretion system F family protein [Nitrososphaerales archaeon]